MPSPKYITTYSADALQLLTSRYSQARPPRTLAGVGMPGWARWTLAASGADLGFSPLSLANCAAWYRADLGITIGTGVSAWADQSGTGDANKNLSQGTGSQQPTRNNSDAGYNNQPTLSFASASLQYLISGSWASPLSLPETVFVVGNTDGSVTNQAYSDGQGNSRLLYTNSGAARAVMYAGATLSSGLGLTSSPLVICSIFNAGSSSIFVSAQTASASGSSGAGGTTRSFLLAGVAAGPTAYLNGKLAEIIVYSRALSSTERAQVFVYLGTRYGITIGA